MGWFRPILYRNECNQKSSWQTNNWSYRCFDGHSNWICPVQAAMETKALLHLLGGLDKPASGKEIVAGEEEAFPVWMTVNCLSSQPDNWFIFRSFYQPFWRCAVMWSRWYASAHEAGGAQAAWIIKLRSSWSAYDLTKSPPSWTFRWGRFSALYYDLLNGPAILADEPAAIWILPASRDIISLFSKFGNNIIVLLLRTIIMKLLQAEDRCRCLRWRLCD